jgi:hypothetical protein
MCSIPEAQVAAFRDELQKEASNWYQGAGQVLSRFGKRQAHSLTGWKPKEGLEAIGLGASRGGNAASIAANKRAAELGLTSLPGFAKALFNPKTRGQVIPAAIDQQLKGTKTWEKAVTLGLPAADLALEAATPEDPNNLTKGQNLGRSIAGTAAGMATGSLPMAGSLVVGLGASALGGAVGKGVDKVRARMKRPHTEDLHVQPPPNPEDSRGQSGPPIERNMSPSAAGQAPDWGGA